VNRLLRLLGYREFRTGDFSVRFEPIMREVVSIFYKRQDSVLALDAEYIGKKWEALSVILPENLDAQQSPQLVHDLETALLKLGYGFVITRKTVHVHIIRESRNMCNENL
jgi:hypothetical protein